MNSLKTIFILLIPLLFIGTFTACTKEKAKPVTSNGINSQDARTTRNLQAFKANLLQKSTGNMEMDSAIWHIEGILNLDNANNTHKFINTFSIKDSVSVVPTDGSLTTDQIYEIYAAFQNKIDSVLGTNSALKADLLYVYSPATSLKDNSQQFNLEASIGMDASQPNYQPFGPTDNWFWEYHAGRCTGGGTPWDARMLLQNRFNNPPNGIPVGYFTSVVLISVVPFYYPDENNPVGEYMIFANGISDPITCIGYQELNYYLSVFDYLKNDNQPAGKSFCYVNIIKDVIVGSPLPLFYNYYMYYGVFHAGSPN